MTASVLTSTGDTDFVDRRTLAVGDFTALRSADYLVELSMDGFRPGPHVLTIEARTADGTTVRRDVRFERR
jgi:hypothetical protein